MKSTYFNIIQSLVLVIIAILAASCDQSSEGINKFNDPEIRSIYDLKDKRQTQGLLEYLDHDNEQYKIEAINALASVQDTIALRNLLDLLKEPSVDVRLNSAFAIGQTKSSKAEQSLIQFITSEKDPNVHHQLMVALGKCISGSKLDFLVSFEPVSAQQMESKAWALYRAGLRGVKSNAAVGYIMKMLSNQSNSVRFACANYLARIAGDEMDAVKSHLVTAYWNETDPEVKIYLASALGKLSGDKVREALINTLNPTEDYRVIINALRGIKGIDKEEWSLLIDLVDLNIDQINVALAGLVFRTNDLSQQDVDQLRKVIGTPRAIGILYGKLINLSIDDVIISEIKKELNNSSNPYVTGELLKALANDENQVDYITEIMFTTDHAYVRNSGITALLNMLRQSNDTKKFAPILKKAILSEDIGLISAASGALSNPVYNFKEMYSDIGFLSEAKSSLQLPKDAEALIGIQTVIDLFEGKRSNFVFRNPYNNPIDWELVREIPKEQMLRIRTDEGNVDIKLLVEESPGTVDFILRLVKKDFYKGSTFHRVVPNFVAQGGCPRGDGYGGTPESIRSEFGLTQYRTGSVGMASAGKDTESCQFFITHRPTPHLDGAYTIFGEIENGLEVLKQMDVGTTIQNIELL